MKKKKRQWQPFSYVLHLGGDFEPDDPPVAGLAVARQFAMISYRTATAYTQKFGRERVPGVDSNSGERVIF